jgi:hypothetical protein
MRGVSVESDPNRKFNRFRGAHIISNLAPSTRRTGKKASIQEGFGKGGSSSSSSRRGSDALQVLTAAAPAKVRTGQLIQVFPVALIRIIGSRQQLRFQTKYAVQLPFHSISS